MVNAYWNGRRASDIARYPRNQVRPAKVSIHIDNVLLAGLAYDMDNLISHEVITFYLKCLLKVQKRSLAIKSDFTVLYFDF